MHLFCVHVAKAGGTALRSGLAKVYGNRLHLQYDDGPMNPVSRRNLDPVRTLGGHFVPPDGADCTYGHYNPGRFRILNDDVLFTLIRPPVENVISIYYFWKSCAPHGNPLHDYFLRESLDILSFARLPLVRNLYSVSYFGGFDMSRFDIIGDYRNRTAVVARLSQVVGHPLDSDGRENVTPPSEERRAVESDDALLMELRDVLIDDVRFFERYAEGR